MTQVATINPVKENSSVIKNRKEKHFFKSLSLIVPNTKDVDYFGFAREVAVLRLYATDSRVHAVLWIHDGMKEVYQEGGAFAGGYGYDKQSAAAAGAFAMAGVTLSEDINGRGMSSVETALKALAVALGHPVHTIITANA